MSYPTQIDQNALPGQSLRAPLGTEAPGSVTIPPTTTANPDLATFLANTSASLIGVEQTLGLPSSPAPGSVLAKISGITRASSYQGHFANSGALPAIDGVVVQNNDWATVGTNSEVWQVVSNAWTDLAIALQGSTGIRGSEYQGQFATSGSLPAINGTTVLQNDFATVGAASELWIAGASTWADSGVHFQGPQGPTGPSTGQTIVHFTSFGDSYTDNGNSAFLNSAWNFQTSGESFVSNGPTWFSLLSKTYGFAAVPRWNTGSVIGNNYCVAGADIDSGPIFNSIAYDMTYQVNTYLADVSNVVPSNSLISVWMGVNVTRNAYGSYVGSHDATDPLGTCPAFTMPASGSTVVISMSTFNDANIAVNDVLWIAVAGYLKVTVISGGNITLNNINSAGNAAGGASIPAGGNVRWGSLAYLDAQMTKFVTLINSLVTAGATKILVLNIPNWAQAQIGGGGVGAQFVSVGNIVTYWNSSLATQMASISQVKIFDTKSLFANVVANPPSYGFTVIDIGESTETIAQPSWNQDTYLWFDNLHPSAAMHRIIYNALIPVINLFLSAASQQLSLALQTGGVAEPNSNLVVPSWFVPTGTTLGNGVNPFPSGIDSTDVRLDYLSRLFWARNLFVDVEIDFQESLTNTLAAIPFNQFGWTTINTGSSQLGYWGTPSQYNGNGMRRMYVVLATAPDQAGDLASAAPFLSPASGGGANCTGPLYLAWRANLQSFSTGDTVKFQFGLLDQLATPANGIFFEVVDTAGTITANFVVLVAGVRQAFPFTLTTWTAGGNMTTFQVFSDAKWTRFHILVNGVYTLFTGTLTSIPAATMFAGHVLTKVVNTASASSIVLVDSLRALHLSGRRA